MNEEREIMSTLPNETSAQEIEVNRKEVMNRIAELKSRQNPVVLNSSRIPRLKK